MELYEINSQGGIKMTASKVKLIFHWGIFLVLAVLHVTSLSAQEVDLKQKAMNKFENGNYPEAISFLKQAVLENPDDAEIYYYLGYYTHYLCYDSRPLTGYNEKWSDEILRYLNKAVTLNPEYGDAYYFIGVEHGARFLRGMQEADVRKMRMEFQTGRKKGGYPEWLIEYARNILRACEPNAILFTGGDADSWPTWYLQFVEEYRIDVTVIPMGLLSRPAFAMILKNGLENIFVSAPISWSKEQILDMHPYKWKTTKIEILISRNELEKYNISPQDSITEWELEPDLSSDSRTFLSTGRALLADIIETNRWERPIYFSIACPKSRMAGLDKYMQLCGLVYRLFPVGTEKYGLSLNPQKIEAVLLHPESYRYFADVKEHDMPRVSRGLNNYRFALFMLAKYYAESGDKEKASDILDKMPTYMPENIFPSPDGLKNMIENLRSNLESEKK